MKYITSMHAAKMLGVTKHYINTICARGEVQGAYNNGYRWMLPEESVQAKAGTRKGEKAGRVFNTTGICEPQKHYMLCMHGHDPGRRTNTPNLHDPLEYYADIGIIFHMPTF